VVVFLMAFILNSATLRLVVVATPVPLCSFPVAKIDAAETFTSVLL
jgi:hypothetical protein